MGKKYISIIILLLLIASPIDLFAFRPGPAARCGYYQGELYGKIWKYFADAQIDNNDIKPIFPGKEFEDFYNKLLEKKYFDKPLYKHTRECSYGLTIVNDDFNVYCKYHGNRTNTDKFNSMSANKYYSHHNDYGILVCLACIVLGGVISSVKAAIKKAKK